MKRLLLWVVVLGFLAATSQAVDDGPLVNDEAFAKAKDRDSEITRDELEELGRHYKQKCSACHTAHRPETRTTAEWLERDLPPMIREARLTVPELQKIETFLKLLSKPEA